MRRIIPAAAVLFGSFLMLGNANAAAPASSNICLNVNQIQRTQIPDDKTILYHMRDGKIWRNTLKSACPMLTTSTYSQVLPAGGLLCANQQSITVSQTGNSCMLGDFTPVAPAN